MTTVHANSARDALSRLEVTVTLSGFDTPMRALRHQITSAINLVVQAQRLLGGRRKITRVIELNGMEGDQIQMHDNFVFEQTGVNDRGIAVGVFSATGIRPRCLERIESRGLFLSP